MRHSVGRGAASPAAKNFGLSGSGSGDASTHDALLASTLDALLRHPSSETCTSSKARLKIAACISTYSAIRSRSFSVARAMQSVRNRSAQMSDGSGWTSGAANTVKRLIQLPGAGLLREALLAVVREQTCTKPARPDKTRSGRAVKRGGSLPPASKLLILCAPFAGTRWCRAPGLQPHLIFL